MPFILKEDDVYFKYSSLENAIFKNATRNIVFGEQFYMTAIEGK